jgi:hypothetical protein
LLSSRHRVDFASTYFHFLQKGSFGLSLELSCDCLVVVFADVDVVAVFVVIVVIVFVFVLKKANISDDGDTCRQFKVG